jgi:hypothetical protein
MSSYHDVYVSSFGELRDTGGLLRSIIQTLETNITTNLLTFNYPKQKQKKIKINKEAKNALNRA